MATFVLVHGAWQGAWCWQRIIPVLEECGHRTVAIDLPGHGRDLTPPEAVTLEDYVSTVIRTVESIAHRSVLVGHSMGGIVAALVTEQIPDKIGALVALASPPAVNGVSMINAVTALDPEYLGHFVWSPDGSTARMAPQGIRDFLCQGCPDEFIDLAVGRFSPEPVAPFQTPLRLTPQKYGRVPRFYVGCERDRVVTKQVQQEASQSLPPANVYSIDADHSPFFSAPKALASCLDRIVNKL
jgi:pimeloyl-ACP methyl ester carboxylesterase